MFKDQKTRYPGIYERTHDSGKVVYVARARVKGAGESSKSFRHLQAARDWYGKQTSSLQQRETTGRMRATLGEAISRYLAEELQRLAVTEQANRVRHLEMWQELGLAGRMRLRDINRSWAREQVRNLRKTGLRAKPRPVCYATGNRYLAALSALLSACEEWEWIPRNPLHSSGRRKKAKGERERARERDEVPEEMARIRRACEQSGDWRLLPLMICALATGARESELMRLAWKDVVLEPIDFDLVSGEKRPGVPRALTVDAKNGDDRVLYFPGEAARVLRALAAARRDSPYVFADPEAPLEEPGFPFPAWRYAKKRAAVSDLRFHDLRHFWACRLLESGASIPQLMVLGGWRSVAAMRIYIARAERRGSAPVEVMHSRATRLPPAPAGLLALQDLEEARHVD
jgi:integrase